MDKKKICFITAIHGTAMAFLRVHMAALSKTYKVHYVCNATEEAVAAIPCDEFYKVEIERGLSIGKDIKALIKLYKYFKAQKFAAVHSVTPKAGLLTALAGWLAGVPVRIHIFTGQVWATRKGFMRWMLKCFDKLIATLDTDILVDGEGQRQYLIQNGVLKESNSTVIGAGSISGVDLNRFSPSEQTRTDMRNQLGLGPEKTVLAFLGRMNHDKGIFDLLSVYNGIAAENKDLFLLLVGPDEEDIMAHLKDYPNIQSGTNFLYYGKTPTPETILQAGDIFVLPTYREGFGTSVIEASALGLPVVCTDVYGVMGAIVDNVTGIRCRVGDRESLREALMPLIQDTDLRRKLGRAGRARVEELFDANVVTASWLDFYHKRV